MHTAESAERSQLTVRHVTVHIWVLFLLCICIVLWFVMLQNGKRLRSIGALLFHVWPRTSACCWSCYHKTHISDELRELYQASRSHEKVICQLFQLAIIYACMIC